MTVPRMRMFAGPNGSGKSTLKSYLPQALLGVYLNPDDIELEIRTRGFLDIAAYGVTSDGDRVLRFFKDSVFLESAGFGGSVRKLVYQDGRLDFGAVEVNSYFASVAVGFLRQTLFEKRESFTFETVMSHRSKVELLEQAKTAGYRTYLYYVATDDPAINVSRVRNRVKLGGHDVPEARIEARYRRSLDSLAEGIRHANRAYIFDNSGENANGSHTWLAEITDGAELKLQADVIPAWFKQAVLDKIQ